MADALNANLSISALQEEILHDQIDRLTVAADRREDQIAEAWDEVERLRGQVERLQVEKAALKAEKHDLIERLMQMGSDPHVTTQKQGDVACRSCDSDSSGTAGRSREGTR